MPANNPLPTITLSATPTAIDLGQTAVLSWTSTGLRPDTVVLTDNVGDPPLWVSNGGTQQQSIAVTPSQTTTYTITLTDMLGQTATDSVTITLPPTVTLAASPLTLVVGNAAELTWTSGNDAVALAIDQGVGTVAPPSGTASVSPTKNTTYTITATGPTGLTATALATVSVVARPQITVDTTTSSPTLFASGATIPAGTYPVVYNQGAWEAGTVSGLTGVYGFDNDGVLDNTLTRVDPNIQFYNYGSSPDPSIPTSADYVATWSGYILPLYSELYTFTLDGGILADYTDGDGTHGSILINIDGTEVCGTSNYFDGSSVSGTVQLTGGQFHTIVVQRTDNADNFVVGLKWQSASQALQYVPESQLFTGIAWQAGQLKVTDTSGNVVDMGISPTTYHTQSAAQTAAPEGVTLEYTHVGALPIGVFAVSSDYGGSVNGSPSPELTLTLPCPTVALAASPATIYDGSPSTLTWSTEYANSQTIDQGIGSVGATGSTTVSPTSTTTYTLMATTSGLGFSSPTAAAAVTVVPLPAPVDVTAEPECGAVALAWSMPPGVPYTSFNILRGTSSSSETLLATAVGLSYTDTPPSAWTTYYYEIQAVNNGAVSTNSSEVTCQSMSAPAAAPAGIAGSGRIPQLAVTAESVDHATSYNLYRGSVSGGEVLYQSGLHAPYWVDSLDLVSRIAPSSFFYQFTAVNGCGEGPRSEEASAIPTPTHRWETDRGPSVTTYAAGGTPPQTFEAGSQPDATSTTWEE